MVLHSCTDYTEELIKICQITGGKEAETKAEIPRIPINDTCATATHHKTKFQLLDIICRRYHCLKFDLDNVSLYV
jgi:hypothetical protein